MDAIIGHRQSGKTTELIKRAAKDWLYIVTFNDRDVRRIANEARRMGLDIPFPLTLAELKRGNLGRGVRGVLFDNVDMILSDLIPGTPVVAFSATARYPSRWRRKGMK